MKENADLRQNNEFGTPNPLALKIQTLKAQGQKILDLTDSNPTHCGFKYLNTPLLEPLLHPQNLFYDPHPRGLFSAREAVASYYQNKNIRVSPEDILITANTSEAYALLFKFLMRSGDSILAPQPSYPLLGFLAQEHGIQLSRYELHLRDKKWQCTETVDPLDHPDNIKAVLFINPNNPTGNYLSASEQKLLNCLDPNKKLPVISDEVFLDYSICPTQGEVQSLAGNTDRLTFTLSGISKVLGLPQMKLSWIVVSGPEELKRNALRHLDILSDHYLSASTPIQNACPAWFKDRPKIQTEIRERLLENFTFLTDHFANSKQIEVPLLGGGWCIPLRFPLYRTDESWALHILEEEQILTHPGYLFDFEEESYLVLSLLIAPQNFQEGIRRITKCL